MNLSKMTKVAGLGAAVLALSAGAALAATATASVNVRTGPGIEFRAVDTLYRGERVGIVDRDGSWCAIEKSGPNGWVSCRYLTSDNSFDARPNVTIRPGVSIQLGFGNAPDRRYRDRDWDRDDDRGGYWSGPRSSNMSNGNGYFGLSIGN
jgi:uncharacterized protein YraI